MQKKFSLGAIFVFIAISIYSFNLFRQAHLKSKSDFEFRQANAKIVDNSTIISQVIGSDLLTNQRFSHSAHGVKTTKHDCTIKYSRKILKELNRKNQTDQIIAFLDTGKNGIREIVAHDPQGNYYDRRNIHGQVDQAGTIFLFATNKSPFDPYTTYFGHNMQDGSKFGKLENYPKNRSDLQLADLYTEEGILKYKLILCAKVDSKWYSEISTWNIQGVQRFFAELGQNSEIYERKESLDPKANYMFLSTCYQNGEHYKVVAVYKLLRADQ